MSNKTGKETIPESVTVADAVHCTTCGKAFDAADMAGARSVESSDSSCLVTCSHCGADNELTAHPVPGLNQQPQVTVENSEK